MIHYAPPTLASSSAPGKVILLGEHSVVYGRPALAMPVRSVAARATVTATAGETRIRSLDLGTDMGLDQTGDPLCAAWRQAASFCSTSGHPLPNVVVEVTSTVPMGRGMGSSAAVAVAVVRAALAVADVAASDAEVAHMALEAERLVHGTPSGIDPAVVAFETPIRFQAGVAAPLPVGRTLHLLIADTGRAAGTGEMVAAVRTAIESSPQRYDRWFTQMGELVDKGARLIKEGDAVTLGRVMNSNHLVLQAMGVSTPDLDDLVGAARQAGALGAKLSGAGGGGVVVALVTPATDDAVGRALHRVGAIQVFRTTLDSSEPARSMAGA